MSKGLIYRGSHRRTLLPTGDAASLIQGVGVTRQLGTIEAVGDPCQCTGTVARGIVGGVGEAGGYQRPLNGSWPHLGADVIEKKAAQGAGYSVCSKIRSIASIFGSNPNSFNTNSTVPKLVTLVTISPS